VRRAPEAGTPVGINLAAGAAAIVGAGLLAAAIPGAYPWLRFGVLALAVAGFAAISGDRAASIGVGLIAFLIGDGFLEDRMGVLSWHGTSDLWRLMVVVLAVLVGLVVGAAYRRLAGRPAAAAGEAGRAGVILLAEEERRDA
jgi:hypothetical protein